MLIKLAKRASILLAVAAVTLLVVRVYLTANEARLSKFGIPTRHTS